MELIVMRHAERDKFSDLRERDQPLTSVGKDNVRFVIRSGQVNRLGVLTSRGLEPNWLRNLSMKV